MGTFVAYLLLSLIALPAAIWFARDALVARLNVWRWAVGGFFSVALPPILLFMVGGLLSERGLLRVGRPWGGILGASIIAFGWFNAYLINKRVLKPKRVAIIGNSLNYVGGWLGLLIYMLFLSAGLILITYGRDTYKTLEQLCPGEHMGEYLFRCAIASTPETVDTIFRFISLTGCFWAAIALIRKAPTAIRTAAWVCLWFIILAILQYYIDVAVSDNPGSIARIGQQASLPVWSVVWLAYLTRSRRVREVYGHNF